MANVLFLYPNVGNSLRIPLAISILSACLREKGHGVHIFDPTFMRKDFGKDYKLMEARGVVKGTDFEKMVGKLEEKDVKEELCSMIKETKPDFVAVSLTERNYSMFSQLVEIVKKEIPHIPIVVGGILPSIYPEIVLNEPSVDYICVGEGEKFIIEFADRLNDRKWLRKINGLWFYNENGEVVKNPLNPLTDLNWIPFQDWKGFDERQLLKPFEGRIYRGGSFEFSRGCHKFCSFCVAPQLRGVYDNRYSKYHRTKNVRKAIEEIAIKKQEYNLEINAFCDTDFLAGVPYPVMKEYCELYKKEVGLPFLIQTSSESITEEKLKAIVDAGCVTISIGVESGSIRMRNEVLRKKVPLDRIKKAFNLCRKYNLRTTANYMVGLPFETEKDMTDTLTFNRKLNPPSIAITYFQPFLGTELYDICVKEGFYKGFDPEVSVYKESPLVMPQLSPARILKFVSDFTEDFNSWKTEDCGVVTPIKKNNL